jgi:hypothetical protein
VVMLTPPSATQRQRQHASLHGSQNTTARRSWPR